MRWPHEGQTLRRKAKYSAARAFASSAIRGSSAASVPARRVAVDRTRPAGHGACRGGSEARAEADPRRGYPFAVPTRTRIPDDILSLAHDRAAARGARDWAAADRIRAEIEAAGWKIVDRGTD